jgi:hypothetical protein
VVDTDQPGTYPVRADIKAQLELNNVLFLRPTTEAATDESFLITVAYAIQRAIHIVYEVEEHEIAVELIRENDHRRIILWEAAEGALASGSA